MTSMEIASLSSKRILIVGIIRNGAQTVRSEIEALRTSFSHFKSVTFYIVESDSEDNTVEVLTSLKKQISDFDYTTLGNVRYRIHERISRISFCRNNYVEYVHANKDKFDYVVVADLDGVNTLLNSEKVLSCWSRSDWDVCTANQVGPYYDIYALRADNWCESDCWNEARALYSSGMNPMRAWIIAIRQKQIQIPENSDWIEVKSAFGGLAIYSIYAFLLGQYDTKTVSESGVSEHVPFNLAVTSARMKILINPELTNFYLNIHNDFNRPLRRFLLLLKLFVSMIAPGFFVRKFMPPLSPNWKG